MTSLARHHPLPASPATPGFGLPLLFAMRRDYLGFCAGLQRAHGDRVSMRVAGRNLLDLYEPALLREALVDHADALVRWERGPEVFAEFVGQSVLVTEGATWQRQRRMLMPAFMPRRVAALGGLMNAAANEALAQALPAGATPVSLDMGHWFARLTMDIILRTLFGRAAGPEAGQACADMQVLGETAMRELFWPVTLPDWLPLPGKRAKREARARMLALVGAQVRPRLAPPRPAPGAEPADLLDALLALRDEATGQPLADQEILDQCQVSFQAGHDSTATALTWWSWLMASHPEAAARATAEVDAAPADADAGALPWLEATLKETLRLYPPVPALMTRRATRTFQLAGHPVAAGTLLRFTPWVLHHDARWFPEPEAFRPERFLPGAPLPPRGAWLPFGTGPRVCLGQHFALLEMQRVAAALLRRARLACPPGAQPPQPQLHVTLRPAAPLRLQLLPRDAAATTPGSSASGRPGSFPRPPR